MGFELELKGWHAGWEHVKFGQEWLNVAARPHEEAAAQLTPRGSMHAVREVD